MPVGHPLMSGVDCPLRVRLHIPVRNLTLANEQIHSTTRELRVLCSTVIFKYIRTYRYLTLAVGSSRRKDNVQTL